MKTAIVYTVLSLADLIAYLIGICVLPAQVPIHFNAQLIADRVGSPWVYLALPGAAALISGGLFASLRLKRNRTAVLSLLCALGIALATIGWVFFALVASGVQIGGKAEFPFAVVSGLPLSLLVVWLGTALFGLAPNRTLGVRSALKNAQIRKKLCRLGGILFFAAGLLSAAAALLFGCIPALAGVQYVALIILVVSVLAAGAAAALYAQRLAARGAPPAEEGQ